tara:strand:- start:11873 stop:12532 length:660 start_codon:yes stop_codon:yes gene_type:complete
MRMIYIIGSGGHSRPVLEVLNEKYSKADKKIYDLNFKKNKKEKILGVKIVGSFDKYLKSKKKNTYLAIGENKLRHKIYSIIKKQKIQTPNLISITSTISKYIKIGEANFINKKALIGTAVKIGNNNIINSGALIEHEATIGNSNHIAPKSIIGGRVKIGNNVLIGLGSKILPGIKICSDVVIGAGAVVTKNINKPQTYIGIPAKVFKKKALKSKKKNIK